MQLEDLRQQNPWWIEPHAIHQDRKIRAAQQSPFFWRPAVLDGIDPESGSIYTLRGPRQVGKTTALKLLAQDLIDSGKWWPRVLYYSLDLEEDPEAIVELVTLARSLFPEETGAWCILLDEVSSVKNWQRAIKYLRDQTAAAHDCFVLTGSSALDIARGAERLPGRRGPAIGADKIMLPLSFRDFARARGLEPPCRLTPHQLANSLADNALSSSRLHLPELCRALEEYAQVGGFPAGVADFLRSGKVSESTLEMLWDIIAGDLDRWGCGRVRGFKVMERTARNLGSRTSWHSLAEDLDTATQTAQTHVQCLAGSFVLMVLYQWDTSKASFSLRREKKLYFTDPLFARLLSALQPARPSPGMPAMIENITALGLFRAVEQNPIEGLQAPASVFYWKSSSGHEIDFLSGSGNVKDAVEVKYQGKISGKYREAMAKSFGRGVILSRDILDLSRPVRIVPAALYLWLLGGGDAA